MVWVSRWFDFIREFSPWSSSSLYIWKQGVLLIDILATGSLVQNIYRELEDEGNTS